MADEPRTAQPMIVAQHPPEPWDTQPVLASLFMELPWKDTSPGDQKSGAPKPEWYESRRNQWLLAFCATLDVVIACLPDPGNEPDVTVQPLMDAWIDDAATRRYYGMPGPRADTPPPGDGTRLAMIAHRTEAEKLARRVAELESELLLRPPREEHDKHMEYVKEATAEVKRQAAELTRVSAMLDTEHANVGRAVEARDALAEENEQLRSQLGALSRAAGVPDPPPSREDVNVAAARIVASSTGSTPPVPAATWQSCRVDDCENESRWTRGIWTRICSDDKELLESGGHVLIGGVEHELWVDPKNAQRRLIRPVG